MSDFNRQIASQLREIHDLMLLNEENRFKVIAFDKAAQTVEDMAEDLRARVEEGTLTEIKGIGSSIAKDITEFAQTGTMKVLEELRKNTPEGLKKWLDISGLGPKNIVKISKALGISEIEELREACSDGRVAGLPGLGEKSAEKILKSIGWMQEHGQRILLSEATDICDSFLEVLRELPGVKRIASAGSLRRGLETIGDIDILIASDSSHRESIFDAFTGSSNVVEVLGRGETKSSVRTVGGRQVDLRIVASDAFASALMYFTGSKEHNVILRQRARDRGRALNEYGLFKLDKEGETDFEQPVKADSEEEIYAVLGFSYIPPERREAQTDLSNYEVDDEGKREGSNGSSSTVRLIERDDIKGVIHAHSTWSDGAFSIEQMARAAMEKGYSYLGITDHSKSAGYAGGLRIEEVQAQWEEIDELNKKLAAEGADFVVFKGIESDILNDGSLDYPDDILAGFDFIIASIHSGLEQPKEKIMERYRSALANPHTTMLGHPSGRLLLRREGMAVDFAALIELAAEHDVILEINANPHRLDMDWRHGERMRRLGVKTCINPDAHSIDGIDDMRYGVASARKGGFTPKDVINTLSAKEFGDLLKRRKR